MESQRPTTAPLSTLPCPTKAPRASTAPCSSSSQNVRVVARVRPLSQKEISEASRECIATTSSPSCGVVRVVNEDKRFEFDSVFGPESSQEEVYVGTAGNMIRDSIYRGFNGTILAYGQTGSGKTFTMGTDGGTTNTGITPSDGVIARAVHDLFHIRSTLPSGPERVKIELSYLEIYNEQAIDLLSDDPSTTTLQVRDSKTEGVVVQNLKSFDVSSPMEVAALMERASAKRATGATQMNSVSSRSHAICTLNVTIAPLEDEENINSPRDMMKAKLTLVDLAGSERIKKTGAQGERMKEGININKGLFILGKVVSALSELGQQGGKKGNTHIPYRDSKLTRLLQDSLGGNSRTVMIACISPAESNAEETINTLRYAERTRNIKNSAVRNVVSGGLSSTEAAALRKENQQLKLQLEQMRDGHLPAGSVRSLPSLANTEVATKLKAQCSSFLAENDLLKERIKSHSNEVLEASLRADIWQAKFDKIVDLAKQQGVDLGDVNSEEYEGIVSQLRNELSDAKAELLEARADAAMARAAAGAVIAGNGDIESMESLPSIEMSPSEEEVDSDQDRITNELSAVSGTIEQKEAMLQQMLKERSCRENIQVHLQNALRILQAEVDELTTEKSQLIEKMNSNMEDNTRRCKDATNPVTKRLREQIKSLENRINELKQKASEHHKSIRMKEEAEKKCARLNEEILQDKRRRADLQKKLKEASIEIRAEKKAAQQNAARMMKDSRKLKLELEKIKSAAEKQAVVLKRKIDEAAAKEKARMDMEKRRKNAERTRLASNIDSIEIKDSRKKELETWIDREITCSIIKAQISDHQNKLESVMAERKRLMKSNSDTVDILQLESIEDDCDAIKETILDLENTVKKAFPVYESSNLAWRFVDSNFFKALSKHEAKYVMGYVFDICSDAKHELDSVISEQESSVKLKIAAAVAYEKQAHERAIMKLKMEHGEAIINLIESTQGAVSSNIKEMLASSDNDHVRSQFESTLDTYMQRCMSTEKRFKSDLEEMKESESGMQKIMEDVTQGISFAPATVRKVKRRSNIDRDEEMKFAMEEESDDEEEGNESDYEPTPTPAKKKKKTTKTKQTVESPVLFGENILDEETLSNLTVARLKEECKKNNIPSSGLKHQLQERLREKLSVSSTLQKQVIFEGDENDIAADNDASFDSEKEPAKPKQLSYGDESSQFERKLESKPTANEFFANLKAAPSSKKSVKTIRSHTAPKTPSHMIGKSPKRKRSDSDDAVTTPTTSTKKHRPLGFLSSSPRVTTTLSSPHAKAAAPTPLGDNNNRTPVMFKHTASSRKRIIAKRPSARGPSASEQKGARKRMTDAVNLAAQLIESKPDAKNRYS